MGANSPRTLLSCWCSNNLGLRERDCWCSLDKEGRVGSPDRTPLYLGLPFRVVLCGWIWRSENKNSFLFLFVLFYFVMFEGECWGANIPT